MTPRLPPPDPHEPMRPAHGGGEFSLSAPTAVFVSRPTRADDRISDALLELRPGLLIVCGRA